MINLHDIKSFHKFEKGFVSCASWFLFVFRQENHYPDLRLYFNPDYPKRFAYSFDLNGDKNWDRWEPYRNYRPETEHLFDESMVEITTERPPNG